MLNWLLRALMAMGGAALAVVAWPVAWGAWEAQKADAVVSDLRFARPLDAAAVAAGIAAFNASIVADPVARHYLDRSELLAGAALTKSLKLPDADRDALLRRAQSDLQIGLANAPVRGVDWLRLAIAREVVDGPSRNVLPPLFMSIETAPLIPQLWRTNIGIDRRLPWGMVGTAEFIYNRDVNGIYYFNANLPAAQTAFTGVDARQRSRLADYFVMTWRLARDRPALTSETFRPGLMAEIYSPADELIVRYFLRNEPGAQEELTKWLEASRKK